MVYKELVPSIKWNCPQNSNIRILILCHPEQISLYLPKIKDYIWADNANVTVWQTGKHINNKSQLMKEIASMDAVICIITKLLISTPNVISDNILPSIIKKKSLLLPIVTEDDLEILFEKKFSKIHLVKWGREISKNKQIINDFIKTVKAVFGETKKLYEWSVVSKLVADRPYDFRISNYFSQSFFISYRHPDGKYIDNLREKIHSDITLIDTQLWYDSYLPPGENYEVNLKLALDNCAAVILVVTPRLLDDNKYVEMTEIPYARKINKPIIPIIMEETNLHELYTRYSVKKAYYWDGEKPFSELLLEAGVPIPSKKPYPYHLVELGEAYRDGIGVEQNIPVACELFYQAIEYGYSEAYGRLIEIKTGEYDEQNIDQQSYLDYDEATKLFKEYIGLLNKKLDKEHNEDSFLELYNYKRKYGEFCKKCGRLQEAYSLFWDLYEYIDSVENKSHKLNSYLSVACLLLGRTLDALGDYEKAEEFYEKTVHLDYILLDEEFADSILYVNLLTSLYDLGTFYLERGKLSKAVEKYAEVLDTINTSTSFYSHDWEEGSVHTGYIDEYAAEKARLYGERAVQGINLVKDWVEQHMQKK